MLTTLLLIYLIIGIVWAIITLYTERKLMVDAADGLIGFGCNVILWPLSMLFAWTTRGLGKN